MGATELTKLKKSVTTFGVVENMVVRPIDVKNYEVLSGNQRLVILASTTNRVPGNQRLGAARSEPAGRLRNSFVNDFVDFQEGGIRGPQCSPGEDAVHHQHQECSDDNGAQDV